MLLKAVERKFNDNAHKPAVLKKIAAHIKSAEKPGKETLDRLSLLAGFQDWESFKAAIYGSADGLSNFEDEDADTEGNLTTHRQDIDAFTHRVYKNQG